MSKHLKCVLAAFAATALFAGTALAAQSPQVPLPGSSIPQWMQPLPKLSLAGGPIDTFFGNAQGADGAVTLNMCEFDSAILPPGTPVVPAPAPNQPIKTRTFGYVRNACPTTVQQTYLGPAIVNYRAGVDPNTLKWAGSTAITYVNQLPTGSTTGVLAWKYSTDQTLLWADPLGGEANLCAEAAMAGAIPTPGSACAQNYDGPIPAVPHLHGGEVPPGLDGGPDAWVTSDGLYRGHGYWSFSGAPANGLTYRYPNGQEASPIWFHDHALGITRLNVYAGLAGAYYVIDPNLALPTGLHPAGLMNGAGGGVEYTVPLILQDRMFDTSGQLFFPADSAGGLLWTTNPEHPYWVPEFVGDSIVVNGKAWPFLNVEPKRYRFWFINGSNARTYEMWLINQATKGVGPPIWIIATDGGYLDKPVKIDPALGQKLTMMSGERYEAIVDFGGFRAGTNFIMRNSGRTPYPKGAPPQGSTLGQLIQFRVGACTSGQCGNKDMSYDPASGIALRPPMVRLAQGGKAVVPIAKTRQLTLNEVMGMARTVIDPVTGLLTAYPGGPLEILVNNTKYTGASSRTYGDFTPVTINGQTTLYTEMPEEGDTEVWEIVNLTADAHPIHLHLVQFQIISRQAFNTNNYNAAYNLAFPGGLFIGGFGPPLDYRTGNARALGGNPDITPFLQDGVKLPLPQEQGWKDTAIMMPGEVTRIAVRWAPTDIAANAGKANLYFPFNPDGSLAGNHGYVWHCHIVDHEDNEMMRPDLVTLNPQAPGLALRPLQDYRDY